MRRKEYRCRIGAVIRLIIALTESGELKHRITREDKKSVRDELLSCLASSQAQRAEGRKGRYSSTY